MLQLAAGLRRRIRGREPVLGHLLRTPAPQLVELAATTGLDFLVLDAEHAAFGAHALDMCLLAARAAGMPTLVRVPDSSPPAIQQVLDLGAAGIVIPHAGDRAGLEAAIAATRLGGRGTRGFSGSHRAAGYGAVPAANFIEQNNTSIIVIAQVEDRAGLDAIDALAGIDELDALFIGRADLACALGETSIQSPAMESAVDRILEAAHRAGRCSGIFLPTIDELATMHGRGASLFVLGTDQGMLAAALQQCVSAFRNGVRDRG